MLTVVALKQRLFSCCYCCCDCVIFQVFPAPLIWRHRSDGEKKTDNRKTENVYSFRCTCLNTSNQKWLALSREKMKREAIFKDVSKGREWLFCSIYSSIRAKGSSCCARAAKSVSISLIFCFSPFFKSSSFFPSFFVPEEWRTRRGASPSARCRPNRLDHRLLLRSATMTTK